ncbi:MAG: ATP-binding protein [Rhodomicrobium sp.]
MLARLKIEVRVYLILALAAFGILVSLGIALWSLREQMLDDRRVQLEHLLQLTLSIARAEMNASGGSASQSGRSAFFKAVQAARFKDAGQENYVFAYSHEGVGLSHIDPTKIGQNRLNVVYSNGVKQVPKYIAIAKSPSGTGFIDYPMEKGVRGRITPKLSLIQNVPELGALIGTGIYIDDVDAAFRHRLLIHGSFLIALLCFIAAVSYIAGRSISKPISELTKQISSLAKGDLDILPAGMNEATELGEIARAVDVFRENAIKKKALKLQVEEQTRVLILQKEIAERALKSKSEFLSNMSHELRTPMHAILSYAKLGAGGVGGTEFATLQKYFKNVQIAGERLLGLLNNLLDMAKLEAGKMVFNKANGDFSDVLDHIQIELDPLLKENKLTLSTEITTKSTSAAFDKLRMVQVLINLVSNAIKVSPKGGEIGISLSDCPSSRGAGALCCSVADEGTGIPEAELETVFEKFIQSSKSKTGAGGTGLGLSICREIVAAHGGIIWAENRSPKGAAFHFTIPRNEEQRAS